MTGKIFISVKKAQIFKDMLIFGIMNPYFIAKLSDEKTYKSQVRQHEGKFPMWNEYFSFDHEIGEDSIEISIFHIDKLVS